MNSLNDVPFNAPFKYEFSFSKKNNELEQIEEKNGTPDPDHCDDDNKNMSNGDNSEDEGSDQEWSSRSVSPRMFETRM